MAFFLDSSWLAAAVATCLPLSLDIDNVLTGQDVQTDGFVTAASMVGVPATATIGGTCGSDVYAP